MSQLRPVVETFGRTVAAFVEKVVAWPGRTMTNCRVAVAGRPAVVGVPCLGVVGVMVIVVAGWPTR
jgi:hypothetical protein